MDSSDMAKELEMNARLAFLDDDFSLAVAFYSQAIEHDPTNANLFSDRAQCHIKLNAFTEAVSDANEAIQLNPTLSQAYLRKGTACIKLKDYRTAVGALEKGAFIAPDDLRFADLIHQCQPYIDAGLEPWTSNKMSNPTTPRLRSLLNSTINMDGGHDAKMRKIASKECEVVDGSTLQEDKFPLTKDGINYILVHSMETLGFYVKPDELRLQVLKITDHILVATEVRPHILLSDGRNCKYACLSPTLSHSYIRMGCCVGSIVNLKRYCCRTENGEKMIFVQELDVLSYSEHMIELGDAHLPNPADVALPNYPVYF